LVRVYGVVTDGTTGAPVVGADVLLYLSTLRYETTTDGSGRYEIPNVTPNLTYYFNVMKDGYNTHFQYLEVKTSDVQNNVVLYRSGVQYALLTVSVKEDIILNPIPGAKVTVKKAGATVDEKYTDSFGLAKFTFTEGGSYSVTVEAADYYPQTKDVELVVGVEKTLDFFLQSSKPKTGNISGHVTNGNGTPLPGAMVLDRTEWKYAITGPAGEYTLVGLEPGTHTLVASKTGYSEQTKTADVEAGKTTTCDFVLTEAMYTLTVSTTEGGTTSPSPGSYEYKPQEFVTVTAVPSSGYDFDHWTLDGQTSKANPISITMDKDYALTAYFSKVGAPPVPWLWIALAGLAVVGSGLAIFLWPKPPPKP
jgi:uncharacterized repeat protein (TIGR02543 family)